MADVIDFPKPEPDKPEAEFACIIPTDGKPVKWFTYSVTFMDGEKEYSFHIWATDFADAERRVQCLRESAKLGGQLYAAIPE